MRNVTKLTLACLLFASIVVLYLGYEYAIQQVRIEKNESRDRWISDTISRVKAGQTDVSLYSCVNTDLMLEKIAGLEQVESVRLQQAIDLTDAGLQFLQTLPNLKRLEFSGERSLTNDSLVIISKCKQLEFLSLELTGVTDAGLNAISKMTQLEAFDHYGGFSDEAIESLSEKLPTLEIVDRDEFLKSLRSK